MHVVSECGQAKFSPQHHKGGIPQSTTCIQSTPGFAHTPLLKNKSLGSRPGAVGEISLSQRSEERELMRPNLQGCGEEEMYSGQQNRAPPLPSPALPQGTIHIRGSQSYLDLPPPCTKSSVFPNAALFKGNK